MTTCKYFDISGQCKFGNDCYFYHDITKWTYKYYLLQLIFKKQKIVMDKNIIRLIGAYYYKSIMTKDKKIILAELRKGCGKKYGKLIFLSPTMQLHIILKNNTWRLQCPFVRISPDCKICNKIFYITKLPKDDIETHGMSDLMIVIYYLLKKDFSLIL